MSSALTCMVVDDLATLRTAMAVIDRNGKGICFAVDRKGILVGIMTDGDVRRFLLAGGGIDAPVTDAMRREFVSLPVDSTRERVQAALSKKVRYIPFTDGEGRLVDYACFERLHRIPVAEPMLDGNELAYVTECIRTNWISSQGKFVHQFESMFREYLDGGDALAVSNGTSALHLALAALDIGPGDEVIVPDLTFAASVNAVLYTGATPVLVDVDPLTWTLDPVACEAAVGPRTRAVMLVHLFGHPCDMEAIAAVAQRHGLLIVEDCAQSLGSRYRGRSTGTFGDAATFSFFGNKTITTGEGGMVVFADTKVGESARRLRDHGMSKSRRYWHDEVGYNYRLTNLQAAIGVAQMERLPELVERKRDIAAAYAGLLSDVQGIVPPPEAAWATNGYWLYTILLESGGEQHRDAVMQDLLRYGIESRPVFYPMHVMPPYRAYGREQAFPCAERIAAHGISLPSSVAMSNDDVVAVAEAVRMLAGESQRKSNVQG